MGCANSKTSGATGALEAPEGGDGAAPPKVMVDGEGQDGTVAVNGNAVACANGAEDTTGDEKEACNGDVTAKSDENETAPSGGEQSEQNGGCEKDGEKSIQDGGDGEENEEKQTGEEAEKEEENTTAEATDSENVESRENNEEEKPE
ncbi:MARCKS-related protein 1-B [Parasteatoda tepidariorum]|uniref:MARCKS-related protein 1-B n=1 Tax=Parasteatoda tepidariorum TaxID=114398 RepID=UPI0039BC2EF2